MVLVHYVVVIVLMGETVNCLWSSVGPDPASEKGLEEVSIPHRAGPLWSSEIFFFFL